jgi:hypothetical protein
MDDTMGVQVIDAFNKLLKNVPSSIFIESIWVLYEAIQISILCKFHNVITKFDFSFHGDVLFGTLD